MRRYLTIDGDFFCHRVIHGMRSINKDITLDSNGEMLNFKSALYDSLLNLYNIFIEPNLCQNIIFVFDTRSWRKEVEPVKPYYITDDTPLKYKENRKIKADESELNYDNFDLIKNEFASELIEKNIIPVFKIKGLEGDDSLLCLRDKLISENHKMFVFCTDGDLKQLLSVSGANDNVILYRNIKSNAAPEGEIVIKSDLFNNLYGKKDVLNVFLQNTSDVSSAFLRERLFKVSLKGNGLSINREPATGITFATPSITLFQKIVCGDKKDNIFPILRWKAKTGTRNFSVSETHIRKVFDRLEFEWSEESIKGILTDKAKLTAFLYELFNLLGFEFDKSEITGIAKHFRHNRQMLDIRTSEHIPEHYKEEFDNHYNDIYSLIDRNLTRDDISKINIDYSDSTNILVNSIPDELRGI